MYAKERKWGICQQNKIPNKAAVIDEISLFAANHPPMGGKAPGIAPIKVLIDDIFFNGGSFNRGGARRRNRGW